MSQEEIKKYFDLEKKKHLEFYLPYYREKNWLVVKDNIDGSSPIDWDVKLEVFAGDYKLVDEKARDGEYGDCLVELIQDLKTGKLGWFFGKKDWILYGSWNDISETYPNSLYLVKMPQLREYVYGLRSVLRTVISHKGWGITWNISLSWEELISKGIAERLIG